MSSAQPDSLLLKPWQNPGKHDLPLIIAEVGTAHGGSLSKGKELIAAAAEAGAHCVKLQHVYAEEIIHPKTGNVPLPGGDTPLFEVFRSLEKGIDFLNELREYAQHKKIAFLCTPFGSRSLKELTDLGVPALKVASPELNHLPLLTEIAGTGLPVYLSAGVSRLGDIEEALEVLKGVPTVLLHCVTSYPAPEHDYNLSLIPLYRKLFGIPAGVSDHSLDSLLVPILAYCAGACCIEKHITLDRGDSGLDDPVALPPSSFALMCSRLTAAARTGPAQTMTEMLEEFGEKKIEAVMGDGRKRLAASEEMNYGRTNRSIHAVNAIPAGEFYTPTNCAVLRTEKKLRPGLHPRYLPVILGRKAGSLIPAGEGIRWIDIA